MDALVSKLFFPETNRYVFFIIFWLIHIITAEKWTRSTWLDGHNHKFHLSWNFNDQSEKITFLVEVQTKGWVGFGISKNGRMSNSDVVIGWVTDDNKTFFHDRYAVNNSMPLIDDTQDWEIISSNENDTHTILQFSRSYLTCDIIHDLEISSQTLNRVIFAYGTEDPDSVNAVPIHSYKGSKNILLLQSYHLEDDDINIYKFTVENITLPNQHSVHWCKIFKVEFPVKQHIIKFKPFISPGNEDIIHHFGLWSCSHPNVNELDKYLSSDGIECSDTTKMPMDFRYCMKLYFTLTTGGESFTVPPEAGLAFGNDEETKYYLFQMHYYIANPVQTRIDSSGMIAYHTAKLRPNEAFIITMGSTMDYGVIIPPNQENFTVTGHCSTECFKEFMPKDGLKVISLLLHTHLLGIAMKTRHFRGEQELPWIINSENYDYTYQNFINLKKSVTLMPGDIISTECTYNSSSRNTTTLGGDSTIKEMCLSSILLYPRFKNYSQACLSGLTSSTVLSNTGIERISGTYYNPVIELPVNYKNRSFNEFLENKKVWNPNTEKYFRYSKHRQQCYYVKSPYDHDLHHLVSYPQNFKKYIPENRKCK